MRAALEEARDEIAAWRAYDAQPLNPDRLMAWTRALGVTPLTAVVAMTLNDAGDRPVSRARLFEITRAAPGAYVDAEGSDKLMDVYVFRLRRLLEAAGLTAGIVNIRGFGWTLMPEVRAFLRSRTGEAAA